MLSKHPAWNWMKFIHSKKMFFSALFSSVSRSRFQVFSSPLACVYIACLDSSAKKRKTRNKMWKISISNQDSTCFLPLSAALNLLKTHSSTNFFVLLSIHSLPSICFRIGLRRSQWWWDGYEFRLIPKRDTRSLLIIFAFLLLCR